MLFCLVKAISHDCRANCEACELDAAHRSRIAGCPWAPGLDSEPVFIDCECVAAGRPGVDIDGDLCRYCGGTNQIEVPF